MSTFVYRVLIRHEGGLYSPLVAFDSPLCVAHKPGEWARTPRVADVHGYYITVYEDLAQARQLWSNLTAYEVRPEFMQAYEIWACEARDIVRHLPPPINPYDINKGLMGPQYARPSAPYWMDGTLMAREVRLIKAMY
jgi:hypothetical protein